MDLDKFKSLSSEKQKEILEEYSKIMNELTDSTIECSKIPPISSSAITKWELESPNTPHKGGSKKVIINW